VWMEREMDAIEHSLESGDVDREQKRGESDE